MKEVFIYMMSIEQVIEQLNRLRVFCAGMQPSHDDGNESVWTEDVAALTAAIAFLEDTFNVGSSIG